MTRIQSFRHFLSDRPAISNPNDDKKFGMNDKDRRRQKSLTLYGSETPQTKKEDTINLQTFPDERKKSASNFFARKVDDQATVTSSLGGLHHP
jgi:hypothetical protein